MASLGETPLLQSPHCIILQVSVTLDTKVHTSQNVSEETRISVQRNASKVHVFEDIHHKVLCNGKTAAQYGIRDTNYLQTVEYQGIIKKK